MNNLFLFIMLEIIYSLIVSSNSITDAEEPKFSAIQHVNSGTISEIN
ncbi:MAG: hypothetical protein ACPKQO_11235 [Nitrososphaeraceae archaeon]